MSQQCVCCGSKRLLQRARLLTHPPIQFEVVLDIPPAGALGLSQYRSELRGITCVDCGHVQFHATAARAELLAAYERQHERSLKLGSEGALSGSGIV